LPMTLLGRWMNWNMRHNQSLVTARDGRGKTPLRAVQCHQSFTPDLISLAIESKCR
jgi:hypothetical protein